MKDVYSPSTSQTDIWTMALFTKSFTGRKQGLSSPNSIPLQTCVRTREIWAKFFLDSTSMVEETMSNVSGVLGRGSQLSRTLRLIEAYMMAGLMDL